MRVERGALRTVTGYDQRTVQKVSGKFTAPGAEDVTSIRHDYLPRMRNQKNAKVSLGPEVFLHDDLPFF